MYKLKQTNTQKNKKEIHCISEIKFNIQPHMAINSSGHNDNNWWELNWNVELHFKLLSRGLVLFFFFHLVGKPTISISI